jgi:1-acyl-sn-glycerol-3-phosphate acyltransferase
MESDARQPRTVLSYLAIVWLNVSFWVLFSIWTFLLAFVGLPYQYVFGGLSQDERRHRWLIRRMISNYGMAVIHSGWPLVSVKFLDCAPEEKPPFVFVSNHRSTADAFLMGFLPFECVQVLNLWTSRLPLVSRLCRIGEYLRIREIPFDGFLATGARLLNEGVSVIVFPEGTRSGSRQMGPFHGSAFRLAQNASVKICPLTISGSERIPGRGSLVMHPGRIVVTKLPSLTCDQFMESDPFSLKTQVREIMQQHLELQEHPESHGHLEAQPA